MELGQAIRVVEVSHCERSFKCMVAHAGKTAKWPVVSCQWSCLVFGVRGVAPAGDTAKRGATGSSVPGAGAKPTPSAVPIVITAAFGVPA